MTTQLACVDTRAHAGELASWREMASGLLKNGGREVDARCENGKIKPVRVLGRRSGGERKGKIIPLH